MRTITAPRLKELLDHRDDLLVINALEPRVFDREHIPGSHNIPNAADGFVGRVTDLADRKDQPIVVYCADKTCTASVEAGTRLEDAGFTNVTHFEDGMAGWKLAGYDVERGAHVGARA